MTTKERGRPRNTEITENVETWEARLMRLETHPLALMGSSLWTLLICVFSLNLSPEYWAEIANPLLDYLMLPNTTYPKWKYSLLEQLLTGPHCMSGTVNPRDMVSAYSPSSLPSACPSWVPPQLHAGSYPPAPSTPPAILSLGWSFVLRLPPYQSSPVQPF